MRFNFFKPSHLAEFFFQDIKLLLEEQPQQFLNHSIIVRQIYFYSFDRLALNQSSGLAFQFVWFTKKLFRLVESFRQFAGHAFREPFSETQYVRDQAFADVEFRREVRLSGVIFPHEVFEEVGWVGIGQFFDLVSHPFFVEERQKFDCVTVISYFLFDASEVVQYTAVRLVLCGNFYHCIWEGRMPGGVSLWVGRVWQWKKFFEGGIAVVKLNKKSTCFANLLREPYHQLS